MEYYHQFLIALAKFAESLRLCSKYVQDGFWTIAGVERAVQKGGVCLEVFLSHLRTPLRWHYKM